MIVETIVLTTDPDGIYNVAPMGPHVADDWERQPESIPQLTLRPFAGSTTHQNLLSTRQCVVHFCSDVGLFARAAVNAIRGDDALALTCRTAENHRRLTRCERYFVAKCEVVDDDQIRPQLTCRVIESGLVDPPRGLNRGAAAVIEAAVLATRLDRLPRTTVLAQMRYLELAVEKTAGSIARQAFASIRNHTDAYYDKASAAEVS